MALSTSITVLFDCGWKSSVFTVSHFAISVNQYALTVLPCVNKHPGQKWLLSKQVTQALLAAFLQREHQWSVLERSAISFSFEKWEVLIVPTVSRRENPSRDWRRRSGAAIGAAWSRLKLSVIFPRRAHSHNTDNYCVYRSLGKLSLHLCVCLRRVYFVWVVIGFHTWVAPKYIPLKDISYYRLRCFWTGL